MRMFRVSPFWLGLSLLTAPATVLAQAAGESSEPGPRSEPSPAHAAALTEQRSALWLTIDAVHRQRDTDATGPGRRLTAEQRLQLREQVRRAAMRPEVDRAVEQAPLHQH